MALSLPPILSHKGPLSFSSDSDPSGSMMEVHEAYCCCMNSFLRHPKGNTRLHPTCHLRNDPDAS